MVSASDLLVGGQGPAQLQRDPLLRPLALALALLTLALLALALLALALAPERRDHPRRVGPLGLAQQHLVPEQLQRGGAKAGSKEMLHLHISSLWSAKAAARRRKGRIKEMLQPCLLHLHLSSHLFECAKHLQAALADADAVPVAGHRDPAY